MYESILSRIVLQLSLPVADLSRMSMLGTYATHFYASTSHFQIFILWLGGFVCSFESAIGFRTGLDGITSCGGPMKKHCASVHLGRGQMGMP